MKNSTKEGFQHYLSERGLRSTLQRHTILEAFLLVDRHVSVDDFCLMLRDEGSNIGHATVYRTLRLFVKAGIARELHLGDGFTRYEPVSEGRRHDHLSCNACHGITEFRTGAIDELKKEIAASHGFRIETVKLELRGLCRRCQTKQRKPLSQP